MEPKDNSSFEQDFNLDKYRNLLERLQMEKRNKERLSKKIPDVASVQAVI